MENIKYTKVIEVNGEVQKLEYPYADTASLVYEEDGRDFWRESVRGMATAFPFFAMVASTSTSEVMEDNGVPYIYTADGVANPITGEKEERREHNPMFVGSVPIPVNGRPLLSLAAKRLKTMDRSLARRVNKWFHNNPKEGMMLMVPIRVSYGYSAGDTADRRHWIDPRRAQPWVWVPNAFWKLLDIPIDHVYGRQGNGQMLCQYTNARNRILTHDCIKQRVVSRFIIDTAFSDIKAAGKWATFQDWMDSHNQDFHSIFNIMGKKNRDTNEKFRKFYTETVQEWTKNNA